MFTAAALTWPPISGKQHLMKEQFILGRCFTEELQEAQLKESIGETRTVSYTVLIFSMEGNEWHSVTWNANVKSDQSTRRFFAILLEVGLLLSHPIS